MGGCKVAFGVLFDSVSYVVELLDDLEVSVTKGPVTVSGTNLMVECRRVSPQLVILQIPTHLKWLPRETRARVGGALR